MQEVTLVIYHGDCVDGFTAAWAAWRKWPTARFVAARYGEPPPGWRVDDHVLIVDFSYPRDVLEALRNRVASLRVFDHHKTAEADLAGLDYCIFDMERSGAGITWDCLAQDDEQLWRSRGGTGSRVRPWLVDYVEDRDLWRFAWPDSRQVNAYLRSQEQTFERWERLYCETLGEAIVRGQGCLDHIAMPTCVRW